MSELRPTGYVGRRLRRREDRRFLLGAGQYVDDIVLPRMLHVAFVRSPHAHARIQAIDTRAASSLRGVLAIFTGSDITAHAEPLRISPPIVGLVATEMEAMPTRTVRFVGDLVAMVVAESREVARDAADLVEVDYEPLTAVVDAARAADPDQPLVDDTLTSNVVFEGGFSTTPDTFDEAFRSADRVIEQRFQQHRQTHVPLETRSCVAQWNAGDESLTFWTGSQVPHPLRSTLATRLRLPESKVRVVSPDVGGAFGQKIPLYREELSVCVAARLLNQPLKWVEDRRENLIAACHAREDSVVIRAAVRHDGTLLGLDARIATDIGAYAFFPADYMSRVVGMMLPGAYRLTNYRYQISAVLSNKCPAGPFRAPMLISTWVTEGTLDAIARALGLDPVEVRQRNLIRSEDLPYVSASGQCYEAVTPGETLDAALAALDYAKFRDEQAAARDAGRLVGLGICTYIEPTVYGSGFYRAAGIPGSGHDAANVRIEPSGHVVAQIGVASQGQGHRDTVAQVLADELGVRPEDVTVLSGDTAAAPYGMGTRGSRGGVVSAGAAVAAATVLRQKLLAIAGAQLEAAPADLELAHGQVRVRGVPDRGVPIASLARAAYLDPLSLPPSVTPGLDEHGTYDPPPLTFANATHLCVVEIEPATGAIQVVRHIVVEDCGTRLNPLIVEGQVHGASALGLGGVLLEQVIYDEAGQNLTSSLMDYAIPRAANLPNFEVHDIETPNPHTPRGAKGMAEGGTLGAAAAVCNAVADALAPLGIQLNSQPLTAQNVFSLLRSTRCQNR
jgi:carbon-monoxide dehydrogenase large subunit